MIPIVVRACRYDKHPIGKLQVIRPGNKSIDEHEKQDSAWEAVTRKLDQVIERIRKHDTALQA